MKVWQHLREKLNLRKEIWAQMARIEQLSKITPAITPDMEEWGVIPDEVRTLEQAEQWLAVLQTAELRRQADRYGVEFPDPLDKTLNQRMAWDDDENEPLYLTSKGMRMAREAIRAEQRHRREVAGYWVGIFVGVVGSITGLLAFILD